MRDSRGFTLIELMITLAILAILLGLAAPSFRQMIANNRTQTAADNLMTAFQYARSEAVRRGVSVEICRRNNGACANATTWGNGWLVRIPDNPATVANETTVLRVWDATAGGTTITGPSQTLTFLPSGLLAAAPTSAFIAAPASCAGQTNYTLTLSVTGHLSRAKGTCQ
ncbi:GspH/FimT family pseudopilin [Stutzerimonas urumqiensis]|uniref:GspH/FimT family pseudopilin n=1 Tax=Stutzerimonas urumqiensis TaxID=638269 RepID=UPI000EB3BBBB|nr:GspH/FimT family pseudopilin [Stutzerimonas urumqiensis]